MKVFCAVLVLLTLAGCDKIFKKKTDAGSSTSTTPTTATTDDDSGGTADLDASADAAAGPVAANEKDIKRFPDEEALVESVTVQWASVVARTEPSTGAIVATLTKGTAATVGARKGKSVLALFQDPKDATRSLGGWIAEDAFTPGTSPPPVVTIHVDGGTPAKPAGVCAAGLTLLFDSEPFCGKTCKVATDCVAPQICAPGPKLVSAGGVIGAATNACRRPATASVSGDGGVVAVPTGDGGARPIGNPFRQRPGTVIK
jgi:hypothetical protein